jgi:hypothetical protein
MDRMEAIVWVWSVCSGLRQSQTKTLADLVGAVLSISRVSLAEIAGRTAAISDLDTAPSHEPLPTGGANRQPQRAARQGPAARII